MIFVFRSPERLRRKQHEEEENGIKNSLAVGGNLVFLVTSVSAVGMSHDGDEEAFNTFPKQAKPLKTYVIHNPFEYQGSQ